MPIMRTLTAVAVLLLALAAWVAASTRAPATVQVLAAEMAPAPMPVSGHMPDPPLDGLDWRPLDQRVLAGWHGPYWLRWRLSTPADKTDRLLRLSLRAASQLYWNGRPLAGNGVVGRNAEEEQPGLIDIVRVLPPSAGTGMDELAVLASSHHQGPGMYATDAAIEIAPVQAGAGHHLRQWLVAAFAAGALAAAWLYFLALQRGPSRTPGAPLLLALGAVGLALPVVEAWRPLLGYAYPWHGPRLFALLALHVAAAVLLPAYLARRFGIAVPLAARVVYLALLALIVVFLPSFDGRGAAVLLLSLLASAWLLQRARGERGERWPILTMLLVGALVMPVAGSAFLDGPYFLLLAVLMGFLLLRHAATLRALERHNALLREERARLSLQLLQRGIQPHWLMNTLTCLQELIEQAPPRASRLVESLAEQFDRLRESSRHQCVALEDELALCRNHLDIVGLALDRQIGFEVDADDTGQLLPPGVLHAQVENALTHAGALACAQHPFRLHVHRGNGRRILELRGACGTAPHRGQGTGTRYIEASLAAAFPGRWSFVQGIDGADWFGRIEVACAS
ncbi:histidine kinase [Stenotrophomonas tumulicola]|uniref:Histidine kinase n=1 Tax=Stenotrophomonas tumulicola TaxID=1685415 RepID=A0A7W3IH99_9GAMM|nr:histidine kinase [Stenotrophomonas tumulicola]MBA8680976.1 histidine kinase [Stenotrophomonas tumulicola]